MPPWHQKTWIHRKMDWSLVHSGYPTGIEAFLVWYCNATETNRHHQPWHRQAIWWPEGSNGRQRILKTFCAIHSMSRLRSKDDDDPNSGFMINAKISGKIIFICGKHYPACQAFEHGVRTLILSKYLLMSKCSPFVRNKPLYSIVFWSDVLGPQALLIHLLCV